MIKRMKPLLITMGILSLFCGCKKPNKAEGQKPPSGSIIIDLKDFKIGSTLLGSPIMQADSFLPLKQSPEHYHLPGQGIFIATKNELLNSWAIDMDCFGGSFTYAGSAINITKDTTEYELTKIFGETYWTYRSDDEVIMFYEYQGGAIELRYELYEDTLSAITLSRNAVLSDPEQRKEHGVTKPWPPQ